MGNGETSERRLLGRMDRHGAAALQPQAGYAARRRGVGRMLVEFGKRRGRSPNDGSLK